MEFPQKKKVNYYLILMYHFRVQTQKCERKLIIEIFENSHLLQQCSIVKLQIHLGTHSWEADVGGSLELTILKTALATQ
jgi:hypothetical protein